MRQAVPTSVLVLNKSKGSIDRLLKTSISPRSVSEIPILGKLSNVKVETALNKTMSKDVSNIKSLAKTSILNK